MSAQVVPSFSVAPCRRSMPSCIGASRGAAERTGLVMAISCRSEIRVRITSCKPGSRSAALICIKPRVGHAGQGGCGAVVEILPADRLDETGAPQERQRLPLSAGDHQLAAAPGKGCADVLQRVDPGGIDIEEIAEAQNQDF